MRNVKKARIPADDCVACGTCVKVCFKSAITIEKGITAVIDEEKCVGCGKCVKHCPAFIIYMEELQDAKK